MIDWVGLAVSFLFDLCKWRLEVHLTGKSFFFIVLKWTAMAQRVCRCWSLYFVVLHYLTGGQLLRLC